MLNIEIHATSNVGRVRKGNEDNFLVLHLSSLETLTNPEEPDELAVYTQRLEVDELGVVLAVSDGMGGALAGEVASQMAVETVSQRLLKTDPDATITPQMDSDSLIERLYDATIYANHIIHHQGRTVPEYNQMGATFTGVAITRDAVDMVQVGDSRAYLIRSVKIFQITKDQSLVQQLIDSGQINAEDAETHPLKNVILQALGAQNEVYPVPARLIPQRDDVLLICSDGLSNKVSAEDLLRIIVDNSSELDNACRVLVKEANERGGEDNITLILCKLSGSSLNEPTEDTVRIHPLNFNDIHDTADQDTAEII